MNRKNQPIEFLTLRGRSGIFIGLIGLFGSYFIHFLIKNYSNNNSWVGFLPITFFEYLIFAIAVLMAFLAILISFTGARRRARMAGQVFWSVATRKNVLLFSIPLFVGFLACLYCYGSGKIMLTPGITLISYGVSCIQLRISNKRQHFFFGSIHILLGILALIFLEYTVIIWGAGFGLAHLAYGIYYR